MKYLFSCILEDKPILKAQVFIWLQSLTQKLSIDPKHIFVHTIGNLEPNFEQWLKRSQVNLIAAKPFAQDNPYCNKLSQLDTFLAPSLDFDYVFLMDCDTALLSLEGLALEESIYAKIVDFPNPPLEITQSIFEEAGLDFRETEASFALRGNKITQVHNCNGGLYIISKELLPRLAKSWKSYARWSLENIRVYTPRYSKHVDQVSFALAVESLAEKVHPLGLQWNYPTHLSKDILPDLDVKMLHFHQELDEQMHLKKVGHPKVDQAIDDLNQMLDEAIKQDLNNALFWDLRYALHPNLGSGVGSRGEILHFKQELIKLLIYGREEHHVIDIGFGDLELTKVLPFKHYLGLDISEEAVKLAQQKRPDWRFQKGSIYDENIPEADIVMCFDVLIHQSSQQEYEKIVESAGFRAKKRLIIGAYNESPAFSSKITHFHSSIQEEIAKHGQFDEIARVAKYRDVSVIVATRLPSERHQRDISSQDLNRAFQEVTSPDMLQYAVDVSRHHFQFFTSHYPRVFEYSWLLEQLRGAKDKKVLDIGAGVCPLPICLAHWGNKVVTVDAHTIKRDFKNVENWNEWGYLDYSETHPRIQSHNQDFSFFGDKSSSYDAIYSISVIEHMPRKIRLGILRQASKLLRPGGELLLTIDLVPGTERLWNMSESKQVEDEQIHGTIDSFILEVKKYGFEISDQEIKRNIYNSRTDVLFLKAKSLKSTLMKSSTRRLLGNVKALFR